MTAIMDGMAAGEEEEAVRGREDAGEDDAG
jgi:hypothetical protein